MIFILYSDINEADIGQNLGMPEYSYYFVLKGYKAVLEELGKVVVVQSPNTEVDDIYLRKEPPLKPGLLASIKRLLIKEKKETPLRAEDEDCVFLSFSPPQRTLTELNCPTLSVFAWEFNNIPYETWDNEPRHDWRYVFSKHGRTEFFVMLPLNFK